MHVNNGMYFSLMDLGRFDLMVRSGVWKTMRRRGWSPVAAGETIAFRKSLQLWQQYTIETRIIGLDAKAIYFEQRMVSDDEIALVPTSSPAGQQWRACQPGGILRELGQPPADLVLPETSAAEIPQSRPAAARSVPLATGAAPTGRIPRFRPGYSR